VSLPDRLAPNIRGVDYIPFVELIPHVDAYVTNGGCGGVPMALANGAPIVVAGATEDKPEVGARVAWSACDIRTAGEPDADAIGSAIQRVLEDDSCRTNARRLAAGADSYDSGTLDSELLKQPATTQAPVLRTTATT
jgi:UDP:flavonoid glycosyltransferase YjiC (YdhE family)